MRSLAGWLEERPAATLEEVVMVTGCLAALGGRSHEDGFALLREQTKAPHEIQEETGREPLFCDGRTLGPVGSE